MVQTGCGAVLSNMFQLLCEPGDSVLIPAPYYPAFENDLKARRFLKGCGHWPKRILCRPLDTAADLRCDQQVRVTAM